MREIGSYGALAYWIWERRRSVNTPRQMATENPIARSAAATTAIKKQTSIMGSKNTQETRSGLIPIREAVNTLRLSDDNRSEVRCNAEDLGVIRALDGPTMSGREVVAVS